MQEHHPGWSERVLTFQRTGAGRRALLDELATYTYRYPLRKLPTLDEDAPGEFYLLCHAKLEQLIVRYRDHGKPFEHYLNSVLSWQLRSYLARRRDSEHVWQTTLCSRLWDEPELAAQPAATAPAAVPRPRSAETNVRAFPGGQGPAQPLRAAAPETARRRLLFGVLKIGHRLEERQLAAAAQALGCELPRLRSLIEQLRCARAAPLRRLHLLRARRNRSFAKLQLCSASAHRDVDGARRAQAAKRAAYHRHAVAVAQTELTRVRMAPTNLEIATVLGIPKGTVDTGLYWLHRQTAEGYAQAYGVGAGEQQSA